MKVTSEFIFLKKYKPRSARRDTRRKEKSAARRRKCEAPHRGQVKGQSAGQRFASTFLLLEYCEHTIYELLTANDTRLSAELLGRTIVSLRAMGEGR